MVQYLGPGLTTMVVRSIKKYKRKLTKTEILIRATGSHVGSHDPRVHSVAPTLNACSNTILSHVLFLRLS